MNDREASALLELFAAIDSQQISLGRCLRAWRQCRDVLAHQSYQPYQQRIPSEAMGMTQPEGERQGTT